jgi:4-alpha-glucanotransferase
LTGDTTLQRLSDLAGLVTSYRDSWGNTRHVTEATQRALLAAMGIDATSADAIAAAVRQFEEGPWRRPLDPVLVTSPRRGQSLRVPLTLPATAANQTIEWRFEREAGQVHDGKTRFGDLPLIEGRPLDGEAFERRALEIAAPIGLGYHRLRIFASKLMTSDNDHQGIGLPVIVVPERCRAPYQARERGLAWGIAVQLYGLRSARNWGIGDFSDLSRFLGVAAKLGADAVGLNPLHALFPRSPERISPYSPSDRRFLSVIYIDVEAIADFAESELAKDLLRNADVRRRLDAARTTSLVDYPEVIALKLETLELVFRSFSQRHLTAEPAGAASVRGAAFRRFQSVGGETLERIAAFQALSERFGPQEPWWEWPKPYRDCNSAKVASFAAERRERIEFFQYLQWQADLQLRLAAQTARDAGMTIGLYHDLALAADRAGAESWMNHRFFAKHVSLGAPPDEWNRRGQNWGLPAYHPGALRDAAYAPLTAILRANMGHGGALRIDHVMGFERTFWIPQGAEPQDGGYVRSPVADMIGVLALESVRQKCVVIGEDLGTLPTGFRERLQKAGILSYRLLYFGQDAQGEFLAPQSYPPSALVAIGTHDLATFSGYWRGRDLEIRAELGLYPSRESENLARVHRARERSRLIRAFKREGLLPETFPDDAEFSFELVQAAYRFLARTPAKLLMLHLEDVLGEDNQVNVPGTVTEHPNWRRKLALDIDELERDPRVIALAGAIGDERRAGGWPRRGSKARGG